MQLLQAADLFGGGVDLADWDRRIEMGEAEVSVVAMSSETTAPEMFHRFQESRPALPLAVRSGGEVIPFHSELSLRTGDEVLMLQARDPAAVSDDTKWNEDIPATD